MRYSMLVGIMAVVGVVACGDQIQAVRDARAAQTQAMGEDQDQSQATANPNFADCETLAARAEALAVSIATIYEKAHMGGDVTGDLKNALDDAGDIAGDIEPCIGMSGSTPGSAETGDQDEGQGAAQEQQQAAVDKGK